MESLAEIWRDVKGYEGFYEVSNLGFVRSVDREVVDRRGFVYRFRGRVLSRANSKCGYLVVVLSRDCKVKYRLVHCLVGEAFLGDKPQGKETNHIDGVKTNNVSSNLEYVTPSENIRHAYRAGLLMPVMGERNGRSKLTACQVIEIRRLIASGLTPMNISMLFGVSYAAIRSIVIGRTWSHVA